MIELLTPQEMSRADALAMEKGPHDGAGLMDRAGAAVADAVLARFAGAAGFDILCGPGNNGGDGYVVADLLRERGLDTKVWRLAMPRQGSDCEAVAARCHAECAPLEDYRPLPGRIAVDALFGAGLSKPVGGAAARVLGSLAETGVRVVAVDLPSGVSGATGQVLGIAAPAALTVTFFRRKPGHLLYPGRALCGETLVADIGIDARVLDEIAPRCFVNDPALWRAEWPVMEPDLHKYRRGHVGVFSGGPMATGAARLSARAAARIGAGAVTLLSPGAALAVNAMHLTSIMLRRVEEERELLEFHEERRPKAYVLGPGFGIGELTRRFAEAILQAQQGAGLVLDADAITAFAGDPQRLADAASKRRGDLFLTPHAGEYARLFPDLGGDDDLSKLDRARKAAAHMNAVVVYKGADTVIAAPDGRAAINANAGPHLATAGSGDVLAGMIAGLCARGMPGFEAAAAAVHLHGEAGNGCGAGLIAEDLPERLPEILRDYP
ncbi:NAD(P)H-hydrate dehydratase [Nitratireductor thuwali]|uniref:Bifunctional NAD(P)H-hydrate repair enzyme n=1 Tax=Nitratireductor thuwali TaxID=2267699 RepID=A0ABY5MNP7_9HYPH|nr:Bifunctional NAD(P)H-hydrate repair enzyme Nnr [Nitratireductor thuwali]